MVAPKNAYAHNGDRDRIARWQKISRWAGCRNQIVPAKQGKSICRRQQQPFLPGWEVGTGERMSVGGNVAFSPPNIERKSSLHEDDRTADHIQHLYDLRLVRTPQISRGAA